MTREELKNGDGEGLSEPMRALWLDYQGDWDAAHQVAQDVEEADGAWLHAYLHRKEGDAMNARYWYRRAGRTMPTVSCDEEREAIAEELLGRRAD